MTNYHNGANSSSPAALNRINYRGYYYDKDLYLYYVGSRCYDPVTGEDILIYSGLPISPKEPWL